MSLKDIEKLREKVEKDPNSKLFVPLAEEYRKEGMLDEAIDILQKGLERQPSYMSARVSLGKIYLEKGKPDEARSEFEHVIEAIPDNLYAHKKLSEIYRDTGKRDLALKTFRTVLKLNPMDEETLNNLRELEGASVELPAEDLKGTDTQVSEEAAAVEEESPFGEINLEQAFTTEQKEPAQSDEEIDSFKESLFGLRGGTEEEIPEDMPVIEEEVAEVEEAPAAAAEEWSFGEAESALGIGAAEEEVAEVEEAPAEAAEEWSFGEAESALGIGAAEEGMEKAAAVSEEIVSAKVPAEPASESPEGKRELLQAADRYIAEGNYIRAIETYQKMLSSAPDDKSILQRVEELRALLKLMGKDKEVLISKLNAFLNAVRKRGDEFFRCS
ncbi:MAG: tetratricopeptide repeat protein [Nitrospirota bacterium]|nr:tetratricopeptide repeat protein [Nitrospirota bacterium]